MKKILSFLLILSMLFVSLSFVACSPDGPMSAKLFEVKFDNIDELSVFMKKVKMYETYKVPVFHLKDESLYETQAYRFYSLIDEDVENDETVYYYMGGVYSPPITTYLFSKNEDLPFAVNIFLFPVSKELLDGALSCEASLTEEIEDESGILKKVYWYSLCNGGTKVSKFSITIDFEYSDRVEEIADEIALLIPQNIIFVDLHS